MQDNFLFKFFKEVYSSLPESLKYSREYYKIYNATLEEIIEVEKLEHSQVEEYQISKVKELLKFSYENVPYYRMLFDKENINVYEFKSLTDIQKIPFLTKEIIKDNIDDLVVENYDKSNIRVAATGGSTGVPMKFFFNKFFFIARENAFIDTLYKRLGYKNGEKTVILRGNLLKSFLGKNTMFKKRIFRNELLMSSYHLSDRNALLYLKNIEKFKPKCIKAYPSSLNILANYIVEHNYQNRICPEVIILASENITENQKSFFNEVFKNSRIASFYGHTEKASLAGECEKQDTYHFEPVYGFSELVNLDNEWSSEEDEIGEIVATGFNNYTMPFIRYRTNDLAINTSNSCECKRPYRIIKDVLGRTQDIVYDFESTKIALTSLIHSQHIIALGKVMEYQVVQNVIGEVLINLVVKNDFNNDDSKEIKDKITSAANNKLIVKICFVEEIGKTNRGKHKFFVQNIKIN